MQRGVSLLMRAAGELLVAEDERSLISASMGLLGAHYGYGARYLLLRRGDRLVTAAADGPGTDNEGARSFSTPIGVGLTGACAELRRVINVRDVTRDPRYVSVIEDTRSEICIPVELRGDLLGVLSVESPRVGAFDTRDEEELVAFAQLLALALGAARAQRGQLDRVEELTVLSEIAKRLSEVATLGEVLTSAIDGAMRMTGAEGGLVWRRGEDRLYTLAASLNVDAGALAQTPPNAPDSNSNEMLRTGEPMLIDQLDGHPGVVDRRKALARYHSAIGVPLRSEGHMYGSLFVLHPQPAYFDQSHVRKVEIVAAHAGAALARAQAFEDAQRLAITDELTGFYNARYLNARLREELARAHRYGHEMALVLIDSDSLKRVNDSLGHEAGNQHLRALAKTIRAHVRATDIVARYGGDEFVVLQPEAGIEAARATAERIRKAASVDQQGIPTSVSIGVAAFPAVRGADELFREADRALSGAKQSGKNAVVVAGARPA